MVKAGSIAYALLICVIVGVFCYAFLMISGYAKIHQTMLFANAELISENESAQHYFLSTNSNLKDSPQYIDLFDSGIQSFGSIKPWGFYQILITTSVFKKDTIKRTALIGQHQNKNTTALYLTDTGSPLFMVDKAKITGHVFVPKSGIKSGYITSNAYSTTPFLSGKKSFSKAKLPIINELDFVYTSQDSKGITMEEILDTIPKYNSFSNPTLIVDANRIVLEKKYLSGNIVLKSNDSIYIKRTNVLEDIIIEAPKVVFESGFIGNVHVVAKKMVVLEDRVVLTYPSGIFINQELNEKKEIVLNKGSKIIGGVVMYRKDSEKTSDQLLTVHTGAEIIGDVFCSGKIQLKGSVIGSVYTNGFYLKTDASAYDNYIMNGSINIKELPDNFIRIPLFKNDSEQFGSYAVIKSI